MIGQTIAHYKVTARLGAGGMGEVYRATDSKLSRDVAIKVIPEAFAKDEQRMTRFQREAQVLASLNHPHIATIHGLEESGTTRALVMELVEGLTLAERIAEGDGAGKLPAIPWEEALPMAKQITEALEYAHERGVIHRDLKPANIKLTGDGQVKVLDFGLAKALSDDGAAEDISGSPTLSVAATRAGIILGTASYMSPEQAKGRNVDRRTDVWAFGCVLYEMLTAQRAFPGEDVSETLAAIIRGEPEWEKLPANVPRRIREMLRRCLEKDIKRRLQAIGEARFAIEETIARPEIEVPAPVREEAGKMSAIPVWKRALPWATTGILGISLLVAIWAPWKVPPRTPPVRVSAELGADLGPIARTGSAIAISHDGALLAVRAQAQRGSPPQIFLRRMDQLKATPLSGTEAGLNQFFSPDGEWLAFFTRGKLNKISVTGGAAITLCDAQAERGGTWAEDGNIIFAGGNREGLSRVSSAGGKPEPLTKIDTASGEITHRAPQALLGGKAVLFTAHNAGGNFDEANIVVQWLETGRRKIVQRGGYMGRYLASGHLVYINKGTLFAAPFDLKRMEITAQPVPALEGVISNSGTAGAQFSVSDNGTLVYLPGTSISVARTINWLDSKGKLTPLRATPGFYINPRFSPDGRRLAVTVDDGTQRDVWVYEWERDTLSRLTFNPGNDDFAVWTPDGRRITYASVRESNSQRFENIYWKPADGTGEEQKLTEGANQQAPYAWHPSGKYLAFDELNPQTGWDLMILPMEGNEASGWKPGKPTVFLNTPFAERSPAFSPDGRWIAYLSTESNKPEVYVRPFPGPGGKWQISTDGGTFPQWSRNGKELFFRGLDNRIMVSTYTALANSFKADKPRVWSDAQLALGTGRGYSLHPDGKRVAVLGVPDTRTEEKLDKATFIFNFFEELRRVAPGKK